eukprot:EG_transcript_737
MCGFTSTCLRKLLDCGFTLCHYLDLGDMERKLNKEAPKKDLATLAKDHFELPFGDCLAASKWSSQELTPEQVTWAATTAVVCMEVYAANEQRVQKMVRRLALPCLEEGCQRYFSSQKSLDHHKQVQHDYPAPVDPNAHRCPCCIKHFRSSTALVQHIEVSHPEHHLRRPDTADGQTHKFFCNDCDTSFDSRDELLQHHQRSGHTAEKFICQKCTKTFTHRSALDMHYDVTHGENSGNVMYACTYLNCGRSFSTLDALYQHQQCVGHSLREVCNVCAASFESLPALQDHYAETGHDAHYLCGECPKKFADKDALSKHEHSTGHAGGGRACDMPSFSARRATLATARRAGPEASRRLVKARDDRDWEADYSGRGERPPRPAAHRGAPNGPAEWQAPVTVSGRPTFPHFVPTPNGVCDPSLNPNVFPQPALPMTGGPVNFSPGLPPSHFPPASHLPAHPPLFGPPPKAQMMYSRSQVLPNPTSQYYHPPSLAADTGHGFGGHGQPPMHYVGPEAAPAGVLRNGFGGWGWSEPPPGAMTYHAPPKSVPAYAIPPDAENKGAAGTALPMHANGQSGGASKGVPPPEPGTTAPLADVSNHTLLPSQPSVATGLRANKPGTAFKRIAGTGSQGAASPSSSPPPALRNTSPDTRPPDVPQRPQAGQHMPQPGPARSTQASRLGAPHQNQHAFFSLAGKDPAAPPHGGPHGHGYGMQMVSPSPSPSLPGYAMHYHGAATPQSHLMVLERRMSHSTPTSQPYLSKSPSREEFFGSHMGFSHPMEQPSPFPFNRALYHQHSTPSSPACHMHHHRNAPSTPTQYPAHPPSPLPPGMGIPQSPHLPLGNPPPPPPLFAAPLRDHSPSPELPSINTPEHRHPSLANSPFPFLQSWPGATEPYDTSSPPPHAPFYPDLCSPSMLVQPYLTSSYGPLTPPKKNSGRDRMEHTHHKNRCKLNAWRW